ncbi:L-rhamnose mutarotase [Ferruginibacter sp.]|uniref:L-rhamnose mutarotase n=1 Tax=Ferruginibacter sp. TaxID=1940288 RepID=UPI0019838E5A|nr:L-rhamnose mutarotase [Ferruginibacter sp.]MBC7626435.1 L-rhamnose mutarotase [Ferruginibacter sp.]
MASQKYCLALDLKDDPTLIAEYKVYHQKGVPAVIASIKEAGISVMDIYLIGNRMFMIIEANEHFSFEKKSAMDAGNAIVQEWESLMWKYQQALPWAQNGEKWMLMEKIFELP